MGPEPTSTHTRASVSEAGTTRAIDQSTIPMITVRPYVSPRVYADMELHTYAVPTSLATRPLKGLSIRRVIQGLVEFK